MENNITRTNRISEEISRIQAKIIIAETMKELGVTSGEITYSQALRIYGSWFRDAVSKKRLFPARIGQGARSTRWFSVSSILALKAEELASVEIILSK